MQEIKLTLPEIKLVGIKKIRTINEVELNPKAAQILPTIQKYDQENYPNKINHRKNPGITFTIYFEYESDYKGKYSYFVGEEVTEFEDNEELERYTIPAQTYSRFTTESGAMANVIVKAWQEIWQMDDSNRNYTADFEIYDQRAQDPKNAIADIYIGIKN
jgi:predicted transcriptional regulator YdeE